MRHRDRSSERQNTRSFALLFMLQRTVRLYKCLTSIKIDYMIIMRQRQRYLNVNRSTNQSSIDNTDKQEQLVNDFSHEHSSRSLQTQRDHNNQNCGAEVGRCTRWIQNASLPPSNYSVLWGDLDPHLMHLILGPKRHLDRLRRFCRVYCRDHHRQTDRQTHSDTDTQIDHRL